MREIFPQRFAKTINRDEISFIYYSFYLHAVASCRLIVLPTPSFNPSPKKLHVTQLFISKEIEGLVKKVLRHWRFDVRFRFPAPFSFSGSSSWFASGFLFILEDVGRKGVHTHRGLQHQEPRE